MAQFWKSDAKNRRNPLIPDWIYYVEVCGFTFYFRSIEEIEEYLEYFSCKIRPSSADRAYTKYPDSDWRDHRFAGDHWERQNCFTELPLYLFEEPKRLKIVKVLGRAIEEFGKEKGA